MTVSAIDNAPFYRVLPLFYRVVLALSRRHGLFTLARFHYRHYAGVQRVVIPGGGSVILPDDPHYFGFLAGVHEKHVEAVIRTMVAPGDVCIDVGANIGYFAMMMSRAAGPAGRVIAFEPVPDTFEYLALNAALARREGLPLEAQQVAISATDGELVIERQQHSTLNKVRAASDADQADRVKCFSLTSFLDTLNSSAKIALLKVDVEGHELPVVEGALPAMKAGRIKRMIIEITPGNEASRIEQLLSQCQTQVQCWVDGRWTDSSLRSLTNRTDVLVDFLA